MLAAAEGIGWKGYLGYPMMSRLLVPLTDVPPKEVSDIGSFCWPLGSYSQICVNPIRLPNTEAKLSFDISRRPGDSHNWSMLLTRADAGQTMGRSGRGRRSEGVVKERFRTAPKRVPGNASLVLYMR